VHDILQRQLKRAELSADNVPTSKAEWMAFLDDIDHAYEQSDQDRYLLERSLEISSREMGEINEKLSEESHRVQERNQQFSRVYEFSRATLEQMRDSLLQSADRAELMVYVGDMLRELELITKKEERR
jgi:hypothetical protein